MYMVFIDGELKPGKKNEFLTAWNSQILPLLKKQDGFVDEILLLEDGSDRRYRREIFPQAKRFVEQALSGTPTLRGFDVAVAETFKISARKVA